MAMNAKGSSSSLTRVKGQAGGGNRLPPAAAIYKRVAANFLPDYVFLIFSPHTFPPAAESHTHNEKPHALNFRNGPHKIRFKLFQLVDNGDGDPKIKAMRHILLGAANQFSFGRSKYPLGGGRGGSNEAIVNHKTNCN